MNLRYKISILVIMIIVAAFATACDNAKIEEANNLVTAANKKSTEAKDLFTKTDALGDKLFKLDSDDFKDYKSKNEATAKDLIQQYDKIAELFGSAAKDFTEAAKAQPDAKFKDYYDTTSAQLVKLAEMTTVTKEMPQAFLDSSDFAGVGIKVTETNKKIDVIQKQVKEMQDKIDKLEAELKDKIKK